MTFPELISVAKEVAVAIAAATTAVVAVMGLKGWRRELKGRADFESARMLMKATYTLRSALEVSRTPFRSYSEYPEGFEPMKARPEEAARAQAHVFNKRLEPVLKARTEFDSAALEAEVLWGSDSRKKTDQLRECVSELFVAMEAIVEDKAGEGETFAADREFGKQMRRTVFAMGRPNELSEKIEAAVVGIEELARPHLRRR